MKNSRQIAIVACDGAKEFAKKVHEHLTVLCERDSKEHPILVKTAEKVFKSGEIKTQVDFSLREKDVYIFQDPYNATVKRDNVYLPSKNGKMKFPIPMSVNDHLMALKTAMDAVDQADPNNKINVVVPAFPYSRQDKPSMVYRSNVKEHTREGISAKTVAEDLDRYGEGRVFTLDIHNDAVSGFFKNKTMEVLYASAVFLRYIAERPKLIENSFIATPDAGRSDMASYYSSTFGLNRMMFDKIRDPKTGDIKKYAPLIPQGFDPKGKTAILIDDMVDSAGTIVKALENLKKLGVKETIVISPLPVLSAEGPMLLEKAYKDGLMTKFITTNAIKHDKELSEAIWMRILDISKYFAEAIYNTNKGVSVSKLVTEIETSKTSQPLSSK